MATELKKCDQSTTKDQDITIEDKDGIEPDKLDDVFTQKTVSKDAYKHKHKIGSRKASEGIITYNEPIYQSLVSTMFEKRKQPKTVKRRHDSDPENNKSDSSKNAKKRKTASFSRSISLDSGVKKKSKSTKDKKKTSEKAKLEDHIPVAYRRTKREASLNASKLVNILYEKEFIKPKASSADSHAKRSMSDSDALFLKIRESEARLEAKQNSKKGKKIDTVTKRSPTAKKSSPSSETLKSNSEVKQKLVDSKRDQISKEEREEKRRRANLARLKKAKELLKKGKIQQEKANGNKVKEKVVDGGANFFQSDTCRAARTHTTVTPKRINYGVNWCECCRPAFLPSSQQPNMYWTKSERMDHQLSKTHEQPNSSSSSDTKISVTETTGTYGSPVVKVVEGSPYVSSIIAHSGIPGCTTCSCGGVLSGAQCQNFALGGVSGLSNMQMLPCHQAYNAAFPVAYPHSHPSFTHCACSSCCASSSYHSSSNPMIHQTLTAEPARILHHPVHLQMTCPGDSPTHQVQFQIPCTEATSHALPCPVNHPESSRGLQMAHVDNPLAIPSQMSHHTDSNHTSLSVQLTHTEGNHPHPYHLTHPEASSHPMCLQISHGEAVNVTFSHSNTQMDHEVIIDVGKEEAPKSYTGIIPKQKPAMSKRQDTQSAKKHKQQNKNKENVKDTQSKVLNDGQNKTTNSGKNPKDNETKGKSSEEKKKRKESTSSQVEKKKPRKNLHDWHWDGDGEIRTVINVFDGKLVQRKIFSTIRHEDGEGINVRDCILVCSGPNKKDVPYVAKVTCFWEDLESEEMMMTLLWYYRPEHTEAGRKPSHKDCELFAAKHRDETSVACIDDKGYVLTYNEYSRYMAEVARTTHNLPPRKKVVPDPEASYPKDRMPPTDVDPENVFLCRQVYDFKLKRILKNPS